MRDKSAQAPMQWWQTNPELGLALGWAVIFGVLWIGARLSGVV
jgi:hypothetical protein